MILRRNGRGLFALGMYELPRDASEWKQWSEAGINLVRCGSREELDTAWDHGMYAWVPVPLIIRTNEDEAKLRDRINELKDHPAIAVWEGPDEAVWFASRLKPGTPTRMWIQDDDTVAKVGKNLDDLVRGYERGSQIIRELDPNRAIWQNESGSNQSALARIMPYVDAIGFDGYPVPGRVEKPLQHLYGDTTRYRAMAPTKDIWIVQQAFAWANLGDAYANQPVVYPTVEQSRFMAWSAIAAGATGINWWGSHSTPRPSPFLDDLMTVVRELSQLHDFLDGGEVISVRSWVDGRAYPATQLGVRHLCRRAGNRTMFALINLDPFRQDVVVSGIDWIDVADMEPIVEPKGMSKQTHDGWITDMQPYEVRVYVSR